MSETKPCVDVKKKAKPISSESIGDSPLSTKKHKEEVARALKLRDHLTIGGLQVHSMHINALQTTFHTSLLISGLGETNATISYIRERGVVSVRAKYPLLQKSKGNKPTFFEVTPPREHILIFSNLWNQRASTMNWATPSDTELGFISMGDDDNLYYHVKVSLFGKKTPIEVGGTLQEIARATKLGLVNVHFSYRHWQNSRTGIGRPVTITF